MTQEDKVEVLFIEEAKVRTNGGYDPIYAKGSTHSLTEAQAERWYRRKKAVPAPAKTKAQPAAKRRDDGQPDTAAELEKMTKVQLIEFAGPDAGIDSNDTKAEIITKILAVMASANGAQA